MINGVTDDNVVGLQVSPPVNKFKYFFHIVTKIIFNSLFAMIIGVGLIVIVYFCDMAINVKTGKCKGPLFDAFIIVSPSMVPTININDAIVIKRVKYESLKVGDIITFSSNDPSYSGLTVTHRIVGITKSESGKYVIRTKGDNNNTEDPSLVLEGDVFGKVILRIPKLGYIRGVLTTTYGFVIFIIIPAVIIVFVNLYKLIKKIILYVKLKNENEYDVDVI